LGHPADAIDDPNDGQARRSGIAPGLAQDVTVGGNKNDATAASAHFVDDDQRFTAGRAILFDTLADEKASACETGMLHRSGDRAVDACKEHG